MIHSRFKLVIPLAIILLVSSPLLAEYQPRFTPLSTTQNTDVLQNDTLKTTPHLTQPAPPLLRQGFEGLGQKTISYAPTTPIPLPAETNNKNVESSDPVELFNQATELLQSGKTDEAIVKYKASIQYGPNIPQTHFNLGIAYTTKNSLPDAIECFTKAVELKPDYSKAHLQLAKALQKKGLMAQAIAHYERTIELEPNNLDAHQSVAGIYQEDHKFEKSIAHWRETLRIKPDNIDLTFALANALNTANQTEEALVLYFQTLTKRPDNPSIMYNIAYTLKKLGRLAEAMPFYSAVLDKDPNHASAHFSRGLAYLVTGDFDKGWPDYEWRWKQEGKSDKPRGITQPMWNGCDVRGKTVFLHSEQGLGDTFQFIRYAWQIKKMGATVIVSVQPALKDIISLCPYIDKVISMTEPNPKFDEHAPLLSLPLIMKTTIKTVPSHIPYLFARPDLVTQWHDKLATDTNFRIGICWQGNDKYSTSFLRAAVKAKSMALSTLFPLGKVPNITIYSLQKETGMDQLKNIPTDFKLVTFDADFDNKNGRFMDTAALIMNLDLVISIDTSICHIAAGLGIPTWNMLPNPPDWRWMLNCTDTPWYPNMRLFRQPKPGDWDSIIQDIVRELPAMIARKETLRTQKQELLATVKKLMHKEAPLPQSGVYAEQARSMGQTPSANTIETVTRKTIEAELNTASKKSVVTEQKKSPENLHDLVDELTNINTKLYALGTDIQSKNYNSPLDDAFVENTRKFYVLSQMRSIVKEKINKMMQPSAPCA